MRQPLYQFGSEVKVPMQVVSAETGYYTTIEVVGTVASVCYDPVIGGRDAPCYDYGVLIKSAKKLLGIQEYKIIGLASGIKATI